MLYLTLICPQRKMNSPRNGRCGTQYSHQGEVYLSYDLGVQVTESGRIIQKLIMIREISFLLSWELSAAFQHFSVIVVLQTCVYDDV